MEGEEGRKGDRDGGLMRNGGRKGGRDDIN